MLGDNVSFHLRVEYAVLRSRGLGRFIRWNAALTNAWVRDRLGRRRYIVLDEQGLRARRKSDTVFIFGCGYSLNEISDREWAHFRAHDTFGFNEFFHERWLPVDFHLLRVGVSESLRWRPYAEHVVRKIGSNPLYAETALLLQEGYLAQFSNQLVGHRMLPRGATIARYHTARGRGLPGRSLGELRHVVGTLDDTVNAAYCLGWRHIILVGIDLYDSRYFWLPPNQTSTSDPATGMPIAAERNTFRGIRYDEQHSTARNGVVELMREWFEFFADEGVLLSVYNPRSLLAEALPVYRLDPPREPAAALR